MPSFVMKSLLIVFAAVFNAHAQSSKSKPNAIIIPIKQVWAYEMPGTRDIKTISKNVPFDQLDMRLMSAVLELSYYRAEGMKFKDVSRPGFAVSGSGRPALHAAFAVFIDWQARREEFSTDDEITIIFFSEPLSSYRVEIREVERKGSEIEIRYQLVPSISGRNYTNFALIPLGKLPVGKYRVGLRQLARELNPIEIKYGFKPLDKDWSRNFLSKPFSLKVNEKASNADSDQRTGNEQA